MGWDPCELLLAWAGVQDVSLDGDVDPEELPRELEGELSGEELRRLKELAGEYRETPEYFETLAELGVEEPPVSYTAEVAVISALRGVVLLHGRCPWKSATALLFCDVAYRTRRNETLSPRRAVRPVLTADWGALFERVDRARSVRGLETLGEIARGWEASPPPLPAHEDVLQALKCLDELEEARKYLERQRKNAEEWSEKRETWERIRMILSSMLKKAVIATAEREVDLEHAASLRHVAPEVELPGGLRRWANSVHVPTAFRDVADVLGWSEEFKLKGQEVLYEIWEGEGEASWVDFARLVVPEDPSAEREERGKLYIGLPVEYWREAKKPKGMEGPICVGDGDVTVTGWLNLDDLSDYIGVIQPAFRTEWFDRTGDLDAALGKARDVVGLPEVLGYERFNDGSVPLDPFLNPDERWLRGSREAAGEISGMLKALHLGDVDMPLHQEVIVSVSPAACWTALLDLGTRLASVGWDRVTVDVVEAAVERTVTVVGRLIPFEGAPTEGIDWEYAYKGYGVLTSDRLREALMEVACHFPESEGG